MVDEVTKRPADELHVDACWPVMRDPAAVAGAKQVKTNGQIGLETVLVLGGDGRTPAPGEEFRVFLDIDNKVEQLLRRKRRNPAFSMSRHPYYPVQARDARTWQVWSVPYPGGVPVLERRAARSFRKS